MQVLGQDRVSAYSLGLSQVADLVLQQLCLQSKPRAGPGLNFGPGGASSPYVCVLDPQGQEGGGGIVAKMAIMKEGRATSAGEWVTLTKRQVTAE